MAYRIIGIAGAHARPHHADQLVFRTPLVGGHAAAVTLRDQVAAVVVGVRRRVHTRQHRADQLIHLVVAVTCRAAARLGHGGAVAGIVVGKAGHQVGATDADRLAQQAIGVVVGPRRHRAVQRSLAGAVAGRVVGVGELLQHLGAAGGGLTSALMYVLAKNGVCGPEMQSRVSAVPAATFIGAGIASGTAFGAVTAAFPESRLLWGVGALGTAYAVGEAISTGNICPVVPLILGAGFKAAPRVLKAIDDVATYAAN